jgi:hypothetical protein
MIFRKHLSTSYEARANYDEVKIIYPASSGSKYAIIGRDLICKYYDYNLLKLKTNATYQFLLTVKGEDNERK